MGRELFDYAFKEYSRRWAFKHPMPADFFRTMEDASGVDLDWFWRGWFYGIEPVDISIEEVKTYILDTQDPRVENPKKKREADDRPKSFSYQKNAEIKLKRYVEEKPELLDFYNSYDPYQVVEEDVKTFESYYESLTEEEKGLLGEKKFYHVIKFKNVGGLVMPILLQFNTEDGNKEIVRIPAEIWRRNEAEVTKVFTTSSPLEKVILDPYFETADIDSENNKFPMEAAVDRFKLYKDRRPRESNPMQKAQPGDKK